MQELTLAHLARAIDMLPREVRPREEGPLARIMRWGMCHPEAAARLFEERTGMPAFQSEGLVEEGKELPSP